MDFKAKFSSGKAAMLLLAVLIGCAAFASGQEVAGPTVIDPDVTAQLPDAAPSPSIVGIPRRHARVVMPTQQITIERHPMLSQMPADFKALSASELQALHSGAAGPFMVASSDDDGITPMANGAAGAAYADSRFGTGTDYASIATKRVGKLNMRMGGQWYMCTASAINKALLVTAAHCVFNFGKGASGWVDMVNGQPQVTFQPGLDGSSAALGTWTARAVMVPTPYFDGTDTGNGVSVNNDIALVWLNPLNGKQIGDVTGWLGYGMNGFSFSAPVASWGVPTAPATAMLTQFGYPGAFDSGSRMQISNAATYTFSTSTADLKNIIRGSAMTGGSSGGPWIANYGVNAALNGVNYGNNADRNIIMGVTSWGYTDATAKAQGASFFGVNKQFPNTYGTRGSGNIAKLIFDACDSTANGAWKLKAAGLCV